MTLILALLFTPELHAQTTGDTLSTPLAAVDTRSAQIPAGTPITYLDMTIDPATGGRGGTLDVMVSHSALAVSLIQPNSVEVTASNAFSLGYGWVPYTPATGGGIFTLEQLPVPHTFIEMPASAAAGTYRVKITNGNVSLPGEVSVSYKSSSLVRVGFASRSTSYSPGQSATLTAAVFNGSTPVTGATVTAALRAAVDVSAQASIQNITLQSSTAVDANTVKETYTGSLVNSGGPLVRAFATIRNPVTGPVILDGTISFGDVAANSTKPALDSFVVQRKTSVPFTPTSLLWRVESDQDMGQVTFSGGQQGLYTANFVPSTSGFYTAALQAAGTASGSPFSRAASTTFQVIAPGAAFVSFQDQAMDDNANGLTDRVVITANLNVTTAGAYQLQMHLKGSNGKAILSSEKATLVVGAGQINLTFRAREILGMLGVGGPYERANAVLTRETPNGEEVIADSRPSAGSTAAWALATFDRGNLYLTGQNSAAGVVTGTGTAYDLLRVLIGLHYTPGGLCTWSGSLYDSAGSLDYANGSGVLVAGLNSIALDFRGPKIRSTLRNGPYQVGKFGVQCGASSARANTLLTTPAFLATQFRASASSLTLSAAPAALSFAAGTSAMVLVNANSATPGTFPLADAAMTGLPSGLSADIQPPILFETPGSWVVHLRALPSTVAGSYQPQFRVKEPTGILRVLNIPVTITAQTGHSVATSPPGLAFSVNGITHVQPQSFQWLAGSTVTLSVDSPQILPDSRFTFANWSDGGAMTHAVTAPAGNAAYVANFTAQYLLNLRSSPAVGGTVTPAVEAYYPANTPVAVTAVPNPGYTFGSWGTSLVTGGAMGTFTIGAPATLTAVFLPIGTPSLSWTIAGKVGPTAARLWNLAVTNNGPGGIYDAELTQLTLAQTAGPPCTPVVSSKFPVYVGNRAPGASGQVTALLNMSSCGESARFQVTGMFQVNSGTLLTLGLTNQAP